MLSHLHRDMLNRVIQQSDIVAWTNGKYGQRLQFCRVESTTNQTVRIIKPNGRLTNVSPSNLLVVTQQINDNYERNVGINMASISNEES